MRIETFLAIAGLVTPYVIGMLYVERRLTRLETMLRLLLKEQSAAGEFGD